VKYQDVHKMKTRESIEAKIREVMERR